MQYGEGYGARIIDESFWFYAEVEGMWADASDSRDGLCRN